RPPFGPLESTLLHANRVTAWRIRMPEPRHSEYLSWPYTAGPVDVPLSSAREVSALLLEPRSYSAVAKPCKRRPGVKMSWMCGHDLVMAVFCFECSTVFLYFREEEAAQREFDPAHKDFVAAIKKVFPDDPEIQALE